MSNTGRSKRLASFNCDSQLWEKFRQHCQENGTTATAVLTKFISHYLNGDLDKLAIDLGKATSRGLGDWEERVKALVDEYLQQRLADYLDEYNASQNNGRRERKSKTVKKEPECWFIKERAKYLGIEITANQVIHIELFANDAFKQRHGTLPKRQLFKGSQAFAYPKDNVDILDAAIKKVVGG